MMDYVQNLRPEIKAYFNVLSDEFPEFLYDYIDTPELQRLDKISIFCGTIYCGLYKDVIPFSNLEHSIGVALIVWNFTHDKKQTLAGLFHDIANPVFKHCIDFMNGDHETQESTEEFTEKIISDSKEIMELLKRDGLSIDEVKDYKLYPIADNDIPKLSADRIEYHLSGGMFFKKLYDLDFVKKVYNNLMVLTNEDGESEIGFKDLEVAQQFIHKVNPLWIGYYENKDRLAMQFIADIVKTMHENGLITKKDLYTLTEPEVISRIKNCKLNNISESFRKFEEASSYFESNVPVIGKYCRSIKGKKRYVIPLVKTENSSIRINEISVLAQKDIEGFMNYETEKYVCFDFDA